MQCLVMVQDEMQPMVCLACGAESGGRTWEMEAGGTLLGLSSSAARVQGACGLNVGD